MSFLLHFLCLFRGGEEGYLIPNHICLRFNKLALNSAWQDAAGPPLC
jgi:hypothetical protein